MSRQQQVTKAINDAAPKNLPDAVTRIIVSYVVPAELEEERIYFLLLTNFKMRLIYLQRLPEYEMWPGERKELDKIAKQNLIWSYKILNHGDFKTFSKIPEAIMYLEEQIQIVDSIAQPYGDRDILEKLELTFPIKYDQDDIKKIETIDVD